MEITIVAGLFAERDVEVQTGHEGYFRLGGIVQSG